jgi:ubiquinone/menaquinone biosynthesis C-methylase UbiE
VPRVAAENEEALEAWDGVLFDRFLRFRDIVTDGLGSHGEAALAAHPPRPGDRVLDIGCGFGDTSRRIAELVGESGSVHGVAVAPRFVQMAQAEVERAGIGNVSFDVRDVQMTSFADRFDYAFARFGTMFFASPVAAMRNVREAMRPGGRLCIVVWRRKLDNEWLHRSCAAATSRPRSAATSSTRLSSRPRSAPPARSSASSATGGAGQAHDRGLFARGPRRVRRPRGRRRRRLDLDRQRQSAASHVRVADWPVSQRRFQIASRADFTN